MSVVRLIVKCPVLPPYAADGRSRNPLYYYYDYYYDYYDYYDYEYYDYYYDYYDYYYGFFFRQQMVGKTMSVLPLSKR